MKAETTKYPGVTYRCRANGGKKFYTRYLRPFADFGVTVTGGGTTADVGSRGAGDGSEAPADRPAGAEAGAARAAAP